MKAIVTLTMLLAIPLAVPLALTPGAIVFAETASPASDVPLLVARLDAARFADREDATEQLLALGASTVPVLQIAVQSGTLEAADRAVFILDQFSRAEDRQLKLAALESLVQADRFPNRQAHATNQLSELQEAICREEFEKAGAEFHIQHSVVTQQGMALQIKIVITPDWQGSAETFTRLTRLRGLHTLLLSGTQFDAATLNLLAGIESLRKLEIDGVAVAPQIVADLKSANPNLRVHVKNQCALGVRFIDSGPFAIDSIDPGTPASQAGLQPGDVIEKIAGTAVSSFDLLTAHIAQYSPGMSVELQVRRGQEVMTKNIVLASRGELEQRSVR